MFKTSPQRRATVRRSHKKHPHGPQTQADRDYFREYATANKNKRNEQRRARRNRHRKREEIDAGEMRERFAGLSIVTRDRLANDRTRFVHAGARYERQIERLADEILKGRETAAQAQVACDRVQRSYALEKEKATTWPKKKEMRQSARPE